MASILATSETPSEFCRVSAPLLTTSRSISHDLLNSLHPLRNFLNHSRPLPRSSISHSLFNSDDFPSSSNSLLPHNLIDISWPLWSSFFMTFTDHHDLYDHSCLHRNSLPLQTPQSPMTSSFRYDPQSPTTQPLQPLVISPSPHWHLLTSPSSSWLPWSHRAPSIPRYLLNTTTTSSTSSTSHKQLQV